MLHEGTAEAGKPSPELTDVGLGPNVVGCPSRVVTILEESGRTVVSKPPPTGVTTVVCERAPPGEPEAPGLEKLGIGDLVEDPGHPAPLLCQNEFSEQ